MKHTLNSRSGAGLSYISLNIAAFVASAVTSHAADFVWDGDTDATWATATNWTADSGVPGTGDTATFNSAGNSNTTIDLGAGVTISAITFDTASAASYTIGTGAVGTDTLTLDNAGSITSSATNTNNQFFNADLVLGSDATAGTYTFTSEAMSVIYAGDITGGTGGVADAKTLAVGGATNTQFNGNISDGGATSLALTKSGGGNLTLAGTNTHSGGTTLSAGGLLIGSANALGTGTLSITGGTTLNNTSGGALVNAGNNAITTDGIWNFNSSNDLDLGTGNVTLTANTRINVTGTNSLTINGVIDDGANTFNFDAGGVSGGTESLILTAANTYGGNTTIAAHAKMVARNNQAFGTTGKVVLGHSNATLELDDGINISNALTVSNTGANKVVKVRSGATSAEYSGIIDINETGASNFDLSAATGQTLTFSGTVAASPGANLTLTGSGTFVISGNNTGFNKDTNIQGNGATLRLLHNNAIGDTVAGDLFVSNTATVELANNLTIPSAVVLRIQNGGGNKILRLVSGATAAEWTGGVNIVETSANNFDVLADSGQTITLSGAITGAGAAGLSKFGDGSVVLGGTNTYTGATQVNGGTLSLDYSTNNTSKLPDAAALTLSEGTVDLSGGTHTEVVASTTLGAGTASSVTRSSGTAVLQMNTITQGAGATIDFGADNIASTDNTNTNGILGTWATVGGAEWASNSTNGADGLIVAYTGYNDVTRLESGTKVISNGATSHVRAIDGTGTTPADITLGSAVTGIDSLSVTASGGLVTIDPAGQTLELNSVLIGSGSGGLAIGNGVNNGVFRSAGTELNLIANAAATVNSEIADGTGGASLLFKTGAGTVTLAGANTFSGSTTIDEGILELSNSLALQNSALDTDGSIAGDASNGLKTTVTTLTLGGLTGGNDLASVFTTTTGGFSGLTELTLNPGSGTSSTHSGLISDGAAGMSLVKDGLGTQILSGNNTYTGGTTLNDGELQVNNSTTILGTGALTLNGGTLRKGSGTVDIDNGIAVAGTTSVKVNGGGNFNWNGAITGSGTLNTGGPAPSSSLLITTDLSGFTGTITHENVNGDNNLTFSVAVNTTAAFSLTGASSGTNRSLSFNGGATIGELSGAGGRLRTSGALVVNQSTTTSYAGNLENAGSAMSLEKQGTGTLTLTGTSSYTGSVTATGGSLVLHRPAIVNGTPKQYTVNSPATLDFFIDTGLGSTVTAGFKLAGDGTFKKTGPETFNHYSSGSDIAMGSGGLIWLAEGTWNFGGATAGTWASNLSDLQVDGGATIEGRATAIRVDALDGAGTVGIDALVVGVDDGSGSFSGVIQNTTADGTAFSLEKQGTGTQTLSGVNTYTGNTTVTAGTLTLADDSQLTFVPTTDGINNQIGGTGTLNLDGDIYFDLSGADLTDGNSWLIVDVANLSETFGGTFLVNSSLGAFTDDAGTWTLIDGAYEWTFAESTGTLALGLTPFGEWADAEGATLDPDANDDADSLVNILEFAFGTDPNVSDATPLVVGVGTFTPGTPIIDISYGPFSVKARFIRLVDHATSGITYTAQFTSKLTDPWEDVDGATATIIPTIPASGGYEAVELDYPLFLSNGKKAQFFRLSINDVDADSVSP